MSSNLISPNTALLGRRGWEICGDGTRNLQTVGVDRHGKMSFQDVGVRPGAPASEVFVGTQLACGTFCVDTNLIDSEGRGIAAAQMLEDGLVGERSFENLLWDEHVDYAARFLSGFSEGMGERRLFSTDVLILMCRRQVRPPAIRGAHFEIKNFGDRMFSVVSTNGESDDAKWASSLVQIAQIALENEEGEIEFEASAATAVLWVLSALARQGRRYHLMFDSLQHSALIRVLISDSIALVLGRGQCAFAILSQSPAMVVEWRAPGWSPLANGFVLANKI